MKDTASVDVVKYLTCRKLLLGGISAMGASAEGKLECFRKRTTNLGKSIGNN